MLALIRNIGVFPVTFLTDYQRVLDGLRKGRKWCCSAKRRDADLWRLIWDRYEELAEEGMLTPEKVKAHTAQYKIDEADVEVRPKLLANKAVDHAARGWLLKAGAS